MEFDSATSSVIDPAIYYAIKENCRDTLSPLDEGFGEEKSFRLIRVTLDVCNLSTQWRRIVGGTAILRRSHLRNTVEVLSDYGITHDNILLFLRCLFCHACRGELDIVFLEEAYPFPTTPEGTWQFIAAAIICDILPSDDPYGILNELGLEASTVPDDRVLYDIWRIIANNDYGCDASISGVYEAPWGAVSPFRCIEDKYPNIMAWRANALYVGGKPGDEKKAGLSAAKAAFLGSWQAWELLWEWGLDRDPEETTKVLEAMLEVGEEMFANDPPSSSDNDYW